jgi:hypothetical protein
MRRTIIAMLGLTLLCACDSAAPAPAEVQPIGPPFEATTTVLELMEWILEPATEGIWDAAGTIITAEGERELAPTTDAGWADVRNSAALVAETGNLLMMPGRSAGAEWNGHANALIVAGRESMAAADAQDSDRLFDAGGQLYQACLACHRQYMPGSR